MYAQTYKCYHCFTFPVTNYFEVSCTIKAWLIFSFYRKEKGRGRGRGRGGGQEGDRRGTGGGEEGERRGRGGWDLSRFDIMDMWITSEKK